MALFMQRLLSLFVLILAIIALGSPSLARGLEGVGQPVRPILVVDEDGGLKPAYVHCKTRDGKGALPCHPDLGVLALAPMPTLPLKPMRLAIVDMPRVAERIVEAELPPPR